jgi:hypothetical protein
MTVQSFSHPELKERRIPPRYIDFAVSAVNRGYPMKWQQLDKCDASRLLYPLCPSTSSKNYRNASSRALVDLSGQGYLDEKNLECTRNGWVVKLRTILAYILIAEWPDHQRCSMHPSC